MEGLTVLGGWGVGWEDLVGDMGKWEEEGIGGGLICEMIAPK